MLNGLFTPLLQRVFASLSEEVTGTDDQVQLTDLRKEFLNFILIILNNDLGQVLVSEGKRASLGPYYGGTTNIVLCSQP